MVTRGSSYQWVILKIILLLFPLIHTLKNYLWSVNIVLGSRERVDNKKSLLSWRLGVGKMIANAKKIVVSAVKASAMRQRWKFPK
jgi:hypothetical protein